MLENISLLRCEGMSPHCKSSSQTSWDYGLWVVFKIEKPSDQIIHMNTVIVTNKELKPEKAIMFYCNRG